MLVAESLDVDGVGLVYERVLRQLPTSMGTE